MEEEVAACSRLLYCQRLTRRRPQQQGAAGSTAPPGCSARACVHKTDGKPL